MRSMVEGASAMTAFGPAIASAVSGRASSERGWVEEAVKRIEADYARSSDTHLIKLELPCLAAAGVDLYLKDESTHPTGSLKHRLARSLFLYGLCNGWIREGAAVVEASSGSTAISEAYFARLLGLPFIAVAPGKHRARQDRRDRVSRRQGAAHGAGRDLREGARARRRTRRPLHGPVHLRRARDGLARQQQHRGKPVPADAPGAASDADMDRRQRRHRRHVLDDRPLHPLPRAGARRAQSSASSTPKTRCSIATSRPATAPSPRQSPRASKASAGRAWRPRSSQA